VDGDQSERWDPSRRFRDLPSAALAQDFRDSTGPRRLASPPILAYHYAAMAKPNIRRSWLFTVLLPMAWLLVQTNPAPAQPIDWQHTAAEALQTLTLYIRQNTSNPPGDTRQTAELLAGILTRAGLPVVRYESAPGQAIVYARLAATVSPPAGKPILLLHHMDVVPADASRWPVDPFGAVVKDGLLWGRGAIDMKTLGVIHLYAFLTLLRQAGPRTRDVIYMAVPDEEAGGGRGTRWMLKNHFAELDPEYVLDEGGVGSRDLYAPGKLVFGISVAEKKLLWLKVRAEGVSGHGSQPHDQNANDRLLRGLQRLLAEPLPDASMAVVEGLRSRLGALATNKYARAIQHSTLALTSLRSGVGEPPKANVIPSVAEATVDCRLLPGKKTEQWLAEIRRRLGDPGLQLTVIYESEDPVVTPADTPLFRALAAAITRHHPEAVVVPTLVPFGTDSNALRPLGVKSYGIFPVLLTAELVASMHGDGERFPIAELGPGIRILFEALRDTVKGP
jgi:acetylornithine deacetylase/succinyl-diaminopimelate desuccinylase-like protein